MQLKQFSKIKMEDNKEYDSDDGNVIIYKLEDDVSFWLQSIRSSKEKELENIQKIQNNRQFILFATVISGMTLLALILNSKSTGS